MREGREKKEMKNKIFLADLTHTGRGIHASTFPLGTSFVCSYTKKKIGNDFEIKLFKFPERLSQKILDESPLILGLSNYCWNLKLSYELSRRAKKYIPNLIVVFGGPNFPVLSSEKFQFLKQHLIIDFYIRNAG